MMNYCLMKVINNTQYNWLENCKSRLHFALNYYLILLHVELHHYYFHL